MKIYQLVTNKICPSCGSPMINLHGVWVCNCDFEQCKVFKK